MTNSNSQKGNSTVLVVFLVLILIAMTGVTVYFWQSYEKEKAVNAAKMSTSAEDGPKKPMTDSSNGDEGTDDTKPAAMGKKPVVVYSPNGLFTEDETTELKKKLVDPFVDWNIENKQTAVSLLVEKPTPAIAGYKYKVTYIFEGGGNGGFLFGTATPMEWWLPECLGGCSFSAEYKAKYPEIVAKMAQ